MKLKYFEIRNETQPTEELLKLLWRKIAMKLHPDKGGDAENFKEAQNEYEYLMSHIGSTFNTWTDTPDHYDNWESFLADVNPFVRETLKKTREAGIKNLEVCGRWIWVNLEKSDVESRSKLKEIEVDGKKYRWHTTKLLWYWAGCRKLGKKEVDMAGIRAFYGSSTYQETEKEELAAA